MAKVNANQYVPDYAVHPGEILEEYLAAYNMAQAELAARLGLAKKTVNAIIKGKASIAPDTSLKLERVFSRPAHFWNNLDQQYREDVARLAEQERLRVHLDWLEKIPVAPMVKKGFIRKFADQAAQLDEVLRFFGIASPDQWQPVWEQHQIAYRQSQRFKPCAEAVSAWLRQGEIKAQQIDCMPYDKRHFQRTLHSIRPLTLTLPEVFLPRLIDLCARCGVAVVLVPELPKTGVSGATRWLGNRAVIQLSLRYKSNDHLWFSFFHEAGHILKHGRKEIFFEGNGNGMDDKKEEEANQFARDFLIPLKAYTEFVKRADWTPTAISDFARGIDIAPGIVVGRLQHDGLLGWKDKGNQLKVLYRWA